jgi:hypothetical protein
MNQLSDTGVCFEPVTEKDLVPRARSRINNAGQRLGVVVKTGIVYNAGGKLTGIAGEVTVPARVGWTTKLSMRGYHVHAFPDGHVQVGFIINDDHDNWQEEMLGSWPSAREAYVELDACGWPRRRAMVELHRTHWTDGMLTNALNEAALEEKHGPRPAWMTCPDCDEVDGDIALCATHARSGL